MAFCKNCGANLPEGATFCSSCGTPVQNTESKTSNNQQYTAKDYSAPVYSEMHEGEYFDDADISANKAMGVLSYIGILVFIPLFTNAKTSAYTKYHVTQGFTLFIFTLAYTVLTSIIRGIFFTTTSLGIFGVAGAISTILSLGNIVFLVLMVLGIINAVSGVKKELPIIGKIDIIGRFL